MEALAGSVESKVSMEKLVVIPRQEISQKDTDAESLKMKVAELNRKNSVIIDELETTKARLHSIDSFYKDLIQKKDKFNELLISIVDEDSHMVKKVKQLVLMCKSYKELELLSELKRALADNEE